MSDDDDTGRDFITRDDDDSNESFEESELGSLSLQRNDDDETNEEESLSSRRSALRPARIKEAESHRGDLAPSMKRRRLVSNRCIVADDSDEEEESVRCLPPDIKREPATELAWSKTAIGDY